MTIDLEDLRESNEFLNLILDNIDAAVLIADDSLQIHQVNDSFLNLFDSAGDFSSLTTFGEVTGCVNAVVENTRCGESSQCAHCVLQRSLMKTMLEKAPVDRRPLNRIFYIKGEPVQKHLQFSTRRIQYQGRAMFLVMIYDVTDIERQRRDLQNKQMLLDRDLAAAAAIQASLLPERAPRIESAQAAWKFRPCEEIGGDIFNFQRLDNHQVGLYMLDVCGHGVPAALISVAVSQFLNSGNGLLGTSCELMSPGVVLNSLDRAFPFERFDSFFTIICMTIDTESGLLTYACGGHPPPIVLHGDGTTEELDRRGPMIGSGAAVPYDQTEYRLRPDDKLFVYTDGIVEARNHNAQPYTRQRLIDALQRSGHLPITELVDVIYTDAETFWQGSSPDDDITILGIEYAGSAELRG
jgi:sigma-B regulation protein RsbU (phosphoserine phosphatase)